MAEKVSSKLSIESEGLLENGTLKNSSLDEGEIKLDESDIIKSDQFDKKSKLEPTINDSIQNSIHLQSFVNSALKPSQLSSKSKRPNNNLSDRSKHCPILIHCFFSTRGRRNSNYIFQQKIDDRRNTKNQFYMNTW